MSTDYPLESLSPRAFEQMAVALAMKVLGPGVSAFGPGPDGGREATYTGPVEWSTTTGFGSDSWSGYVVLQAKQREQNGNPRSNATWLWGQIRAELDVWTREDTKRHPIPHYLIFITNVRLSSVSDVGGIDAVERQIRDHITGADRPPLRNGEKAKPTLQSLGLRGWKVWHRDQLHALLTTHGSVRDAFPAMLTAGDIITRLGMLAALVNPEQLHELLTTHARSALANEQWVNFGEAGGGTGRHTISRVIVDLPALASDASTVKTVNVLRTLVEHGDTVLKRTMHPTDQPRHCLITGAAGNGKSTLSKYLTQHYRAQFLSDEMYPAEISSLIAHSQEAAERLNLPAPKNRRWAVRVDLSDLAHAIGTSQRSLMRGLAEHVSQRADLAIEPATLKRWMRAWPWLVVLDGLDEVTVPAVRQRILDEILSFISEADSQDADLLVVLTTRPTGFSERSMLRDFVRFDLTYLPLPHAVAYGRHMISNRLSDDQDRRNIVLRRFEYASEDAATARLLKTPLQVLMLTFILEASGKLIASDRYQLFWTFYNMMYDREAGKPTGWTTILSSHRSDISELHQRVGYLLQEQTEKSGESRARLPIQRLRSLAIARLVDLGHDQERDASTIADKIIQIATQRLVLLVPTEDDTVSFEVRSFQELMAARAITDATDEIVSQRLAITAPSPHWRNTWLFAAGRLFSESADHRRELLVDLLERIDTSDQWRAGWLCPVGPEIAAQLLDEGIASSLPSVQRRLTGVALRTLNGTATDNLRSIAIGLTAVANSNERAKLQVRNALKGAAAGTPAARAIADMLCGYGDFGSRIPGVNGVSPEPAEQEPTGRRIQVGAFLAGFRPDVGSLEQDVEAIVQRALLDLNRVTMILVNGDDAHALPHGIKATGDWSPTISALEDVDASATLELLFGSIPPQQWRIPNIIAEAVRPALTRRPLGAQLGLTY